MGIFSQVKSLQQALNFSKEFQGLPNFLKIFSQIKYKPLNVFNSCDEFIREAMKLYIKEKKKRELATRMKKGYEEMASINIELSEYCLRADSQQQQSYEEKLAECE